MRESAQPIPDPDVQQVIENELRLLDPSVRRSRSATAALLDPEFREFGSSGHVWDHESILDLLNQDDAPPPAVDEIRASRLGPDVVLLTYRTRTPARTALRSCIWHGQDGGPWRVYFHQGTPLPTAG
jgi:hypothetical protein